jgi:Short C-terminal domain
VSGNVRRRQEERYAEGAEAPPAAYEASPTPAAPAGPGPDAIEQLKELAELKDQGILTEEEFTAQKAKILGE